MTKKQQISAKRKALQQIQERLPEVLSEVIRVRNDVLAASLSRTHKVCGKPNCKCTTGDKHIYYQLSWNEKGKRRSSHVKAGDVDKTKAAVGRYRHLRQRRSELLKLAAEGAELIDSLTELLKISLPKKK